MNLKLTNKLFLVFLMLSGLSEAQTTSELEAKAKETMLHATKYMVEEVSNNGGYLWNYLPNFSRQWGEMEAFKTQIWVQHPGTVSMGHVFLDAYSATGVEYYYSAAEKAASALIWGQGTAGGWNYIVDFAGDPSDVAILKGGRDVDQRNVNDAAARITTASLGKLFEFEGSSTTIAEASGNPPGEKVLGLSKRISAYRNSIKDATNDKRKVSKIPLLEYEKYMQKKKEKEAPPPGTTTQLDAWMRGSGNT